VTWRHWTAAGLAALYLLGRACLTLATMQAKQRLMQLELDHPPEAGKSEQDSSRPSAP
jgi:hypothetical protein